MIGRRAEKEGTAGKTWLLAGMCILLLVMITAAVLFLMRVEKITVKGNRKYLPEEVISMVFADPKDKSLLMILLHEKTGKHKNLPFIYSYEVEITGPDSCTVIVYEKKPIGYITYMGSNMYFDKDGNIIESTENILEGVPEVTGLRYGKIILNKKLDVAGSAVFEKITNIAFQLESYGIGMQRLDIDALGNVTVYLDDGSIRVKLGNDDAFPEKLSLINDVYPTMKAKEMKGTADLSGYSDIKSDGFSFIPEE